MKSARSICAMWIKAGDILSRINHWTGIPSPLADKKFKHGLGTHAASTFRIDLGGKANRFTAMVGVDDEVLPKGQGGTITFKVVGDGRVLWESGVMRAEAPAKPVNVDLKGGKHLTLNVGDANDGTSWDHADWANAIITMNSGRPEAFGVPLESAVILTPKPSPQAHINGAKVFGVRPGSPFLFTIPASGDRPMTFAADNLPAGLKLVPQQDLKIHFRRFYAVSCGCTKTPLYHYIYWLKYVFIASI